MILFELIGAKMRYVNIVLTLTICGTALLGDYVVFKSKYSSSQVFRAFADTAVHGLIGFLSSLLFFSHGINVTTQALVYNVLFCSLMSSFIDIDHFIVARSFNLKDIVNVNWRGIFHNTSFCITIATILLVSSHLNRKLNVYLLTYMLIIAFTSHHLRDANRRGLWFYPYGHTPPLSRFLYILLICMLPLVFAYVFNYTQSVFKHNVVIQYEHV